MALLDAIRSLLSPDAWSAAVRLARSGQVRLLASSDDEIRLAVRLSARPLPYEVHLWPEDEDWGCDCDSRADACVHVAAAAISWNQDPQGEPAAAPPSLAVGNRLTRTADGLSLQQVLVRKVPTPREDPLRAAIASSGAWASPGDLEVEAALALRTGPRIARELWPRLLAGLAEAADVTLDGEKVAVSREHVHGVVLVEDDGPGFRLRLVRDSRITEVFRVGAVRVGGTIHPAGSTALSAMERTRLVSGIRFSPDQVGSLVGEILPSLEKRIPVEVRTGRLPRTEPMVPALGLHLEPGDDGGLEVLPLLLYGDPPLARVDGDDLMLLGGVVPVRDRTEEDRLRRRCNDLFLVAPGRRRSLSAEEAIKLVAGVLPRFKGRFVRGEELVDRFRMVDRAFAPSMRIQAARDRFTVDVDLGGFDPEALLQSWHSGSPLVPLLDGGFAPTPQEWLDENGWRLEELLAARGEDGSVPRHLAPTLSALATATGAGVPEELRSLRAGLEDFRGLQEVPLPEGLQADLRPYQRRGVDWLAFLRQVDAGGILADDMGLGKTLQALVAMATVPGPHLVVAPTSVIGNWVHETRRFLPDVSTCLYHGPQRRLDPDARITVTSYALLRRDADLLTERSWSYAVLDEAQFIKNPDSQVARSARRLQARHRLALTGTPVENRLEELWSLFSFALPGFLGGRTAFSQRAADSLSSGGPGALSWLRQRVRPFVLRRMKQEVAPELPPRTDMVVSCELEDDQRAFYDVLRNKARHVAGQDGGTMSILEQLLRLRQAACHPAMVPGGGGISSAKVDLLLDQLAALVEEGHKALVFSQWTSFLDILGPALDEAGIPSCRLDGSTRDRQAVVDTFQSPDGPPVFLVSLKAGGTGLNLTAADYVFHMDPWWNPAVEDQAVDRAHRIGQARPVFSCRVVASGTVEERIIALQAAKRDLARSAMSDEAVLASQLTRDELLSLLD